MDEKGQLSMEFVFLIGVLLIIVAGCSIYILDENELVIAMSAARQGVIEGIALDSVAVFPDDAFNDYQFSKNALLIPKSVKLVKINYTNMGYDSKYDKEKIQFNVTVSSDVELDKEDKDSAGDRINYNLRKTIAKSFDSEKLTNELYNPVFSKHYIYTTSKVKWV